MGLNQKRKSIEYFQEIELCHPVLLSFLNTKMELTNILTDFNWHFKTNEENRYKPILVLYGLKQDIEKMIIEINILLKELTIIKINLNENFDLDLLSKYLDVYIKIYLLLNLSLFQLIYYFLIYFCFYFVSFYFYVSIWIVLI